MSQTSILRRLGALGDIHCETENLRTALEFLRTAAVERLMAVGDVADGPGDLNECCRLLEEHEVACVRGNHERWLMHGEMRHLPEITPEDAVGMETRGFLSHLPVTLDFETVAGRLLLCHGLGTFDMGGVKPTDPEILLETNDSLLKLVIEKQYRFVLNGHTHRRMVRRFGGMTIINAGTLYHRHHPCFLTADFEAGVVQFYDLPGGGQVTDAECFKLDL